jgi:hypothetical protein
MATNNATPLQVDTLFRKLPTEREARWYLLKRFFSGWYGRLEPGDGCPRESILASEQRLQGALPPALREWYELAARRKAVWSCQDHFLQPEELRIENNKLIICIENQAVVRWAIPLDALLDDDPPVFVSNQSDATDWLEEASRFSTFILALMLFDVKFSHPSRFCANGQATEESLVAIARTYQKLDFPDLNWPAHPTRIYGGSDLVVETNGETWIWVTARSKAFFCPAIDLIASTGVTWEHVTDL